MSGRQSECSERCEWNWNVLLLSRLAQDTKSAGGIVLKLTTPPAFMDLIIIYMWKHCDYGHLTNIFDEHVSNFTKIEVKAWGCCKATDSLQTHHQTHLILRLEGPHVPAPFQELPSCRHEALWCLQLLTDHLQHR